MMAVVDTSLDYIIFFLQAVSMFGTSVITWKYGSLIKKVINTGTIKPYKDSIMIFDANSYISEDVFCNMISSLSGLYVGKTIWPICIPTILYNVEKKYGENIRAFMIELKNTCQYSNIPIDNKEK